MESLTNRLKQAARQQGFTLVGITTPEKLVSFPHYADWIAAGRHGEMAYLAVERALERREDPRRILPECESILMLGIPYAHPGPPEAPASERPEGRIAAYAWNEDYHDALKPRLEALIAFLEAETGAPVPNRWYTDTGPLLERELAQRAGLGWVGRNSMLIHPEAGSTFLLAEILLGVPLEPDAPITTDHCGTCTACITACPTGCILPERTLDAARCISYLTIELKGAIPAELRPQMGSWVFGCDICQQVCPWNERFAPAQGDPAFAPRPETSTVDLIEELALTPEAFNAKFKGSPLKRAKRRGYLRNVTVALGNADDERAVPALTAALGDAEPLVRQHAAWALGQTGGAAARTALRTALKSEVNGIIREEILRALETAD